jgi:LysR family nitrogen assimilation transcriptional regulator
MELRRLRYFLRTAAEGSLGKASRSTGIAQPALGRQIALLEEELGVKLFERVAKGMVLTEEGAYLKEALEHPLQQMDLALHNVRAYSSRVEAALTFGLPPTVAKLMGPRLLSRLGRDLPHLKLRVVEDESVRLAADISKGLIDIAILVDAIPDSRAFHAEVMTERLLLVGHRGAPVLEQQTIEFRELRHLPLLLPGPQSALRTHLEKTAAGAEALIEAAFEIDSFEILMRAVADGAGFAILPAVALNSCTDAGQVSGIPIVDPDLDQSVFWAVQPSWRVPRATYNEVERAIFEEWYTAVDAGLWPATWKLDLDRLSMPLRLEARQ